jgi:hypothetical protein
MVGFGHLAQSRIDHLYRQTGSGCELREPFSSEVNTAVVGSNASVLLHWSCMRKPTTTGFTMTTQIQDQSPPTWPMVLLS